MSDFRPTAVAWGFALANLALALVLAFGVFFVLPTRWWVVDVPSAVVVALMVGAGVGYLRRDRWGLILARIAAAAVLVGGLATFAAITLSTAFLQGVHGVLGKGTSMLFLLLVIPVGTWLVLFPALQLGWLHGQPPRR